MTVLPERLTVLNGGPTSDERDARLTEGADALAERRSVSSLLARQRLLLTIAGALMTFGACLILLGWWGAAQSTLVEEQVPYLISGGLLGVALAIIGAVCLLAHWLTVGIQEARAQELARREDHAELIAALQSLVAKLDPEEDQANGRARGTRTERPLRRAPRSS